MLRCLIAAEVADMPVNVKADENHDNGDKNGVEGAHGVAQVFPVLA